MLSSKQITVAPGNEFQEHSCGGKTQISLCSHNLCRLERCGKGLTDFSRLKDYKRMQRKLLIGSSIKSSPGKAGKCTVYPVCSATYWQILQPLAVYLQKVHRLLTSEARGRVPHEVILMWTL